MGQILTNTYKYFYPNTNKLTDMYNLDHYFMDLDEHEHIDSEARLYRKTVKEQQKKFLHYR